MTGRRCSAVENALQAVQHGLKPAAAAKMYGCSARSVWRALAAEKKPGATKGNCVEGRILAAPPDSAGT